MKKNRGPGETILNGQKAENLSSRYKLSNNEADQIKIIHELEVFQIELEMQNEELKLAATKAATAKALYDFSPAGCFTIESDGTISEMNLNGARMLGKERSKLFKRNFMEFVSPETLPVFIDFLYEAGETNSKQICEVKLVVNEKSPTYVYLEGFVAINEQKCLVTAIDITENKKAEASLIQSEERYRTLFNSMIEGFCIIEVIFDENNKAVDYLFLETNTAYEEKSGLKDVVGKLMRDIVPDFEDYWFEMYGKIALTGELMRFENESKALNKWFEVCAFRIGGPGSRKVAVCFNDATERKHAEKTLFQSTEQFRLLFENSLDAILFTNPDGTIYSANAEAERMLGRSEEEIIRLKRYDISDINDPRLKPALEERLKTGRFKGELNFLKKDGTPFPVELTSTVFKDSNGIERSSMIVRDITERKRAEAELIAAKEKAEESDRLKSAFLANMSHELRTPLNSIIGFSELLLNPDFDLKQESQYAQIINTSGNNLLSIINDLMDISKIEAGQVQVVNKLFSVNQLMNELHEEYSLKAIQKGIEFILDPLNLVEEVFIESDQTKIRQILVNLVGNSIKFTEKGFVKIGMNIIEGFVQFHVKDTGIGIPAKFQTQIFERFRQVESFDSRKYGGSGLGLAISKSLTELLGGTLWLESKKGKGSTFYFTIPINP